MRLSGHYFPNYWRIYSQGYCPSNQGTHYWTRLHHCFPDRWRDGSDSSLKASSTRTAGPGQYMDGTSDPWPTSGDPNIANRTHFERNAQSFQPSNFRRCRRRIYLYEVLLIQLKYLVMSFKWSHSSEYFSHELRSSAFDCLFRYCVTPILGQLYEPLRYYTAFYHELKRRVVMREQLPM
jgi:hypothetical protein